MALKKSSIFNQVHNPPKRKYEAKQRKENILTLQAIAHILK